MTYATLQNWQHELTAKGLSHNDTVRLLQDAQEQIDALQAELTRVKAEREQAGKVHLALNKAVCDMVEERDALRAALRDLLGAVTGREYPVGFGEFLDDVYPAVDNARRVLGEVKG